MQAFAFNLAPTPNSPTFGCARPFQFWPSTSEEMNRTLFYGPI